jgi:hypothetical protein
MLDEEFLALSQAAEQTADNGAGLRREGDSASEPIGRELGGGGADAPVASSPARLWPASGSPMLRFAATGSPMLRFALSSPDANFHTADYISKILSDDPLLRSPPLEAPLMFVDTHGELVMSSVPDGRPPSPPVPGSASAGANPGAIAAAARFSPGISAESLNASTVTGGNALDFVLPGMVSMRPVGGARRQQPAHIGLHRQRCPKSGVGEGHVAEGSLTARAIKGAAERKRAAAVAEAAAATVDAATPSRAAEKRTDRKRKRASVGGEEAVGGGARGGDGPGSGRGGGGGGGSAPGADLTTPAVQSQWSEDELRRIRRVKNRASVEKCRNKQRRRMEALEVELHALHQENNHLQAVTKCIMETFETISREVFAVTGTRPALTLC